MKEIVEHLLQAPDSQLDASMKPLIEKWNDPPCPSEILEVLDHCIYGALASGFVVALLQTMYEMACKKNDITHADVADNATWRD
jgi:hypothetical protein